MRKKRALIASCTIVLAVGAFAISKNISSTHARRNLPPQQQSTQEAYTVPDHVVYGFLFGKVDSLNKKTRELQSQGRIGRTPYLPLKDEANLSDAQARVLSEIASACMQEVEQQDARARVIINAFRAQFPDGKIPKGVKPPPPPPELKTMWEERNAIILRARDRLRAAFGEQAFAQFDNHSKFRYGTNKAPVTINPVRPTSK